MRILITGAAGYIGSHAVAGLKQQGHEVHGWTFPGRSPRRPEHLGVPFHVLDAGDEEAVFALLQTILFIAWPWRMCMPPLRCVSHPTWENNVGPPPAFGGRRAGVPKFAFSSTCAVLRDSHCLVREDDPIRPMSLWLHQSRLRAFDRKTVSAASMAGAPFRRDFAVFQRLWGRGGASASIAGSGHDVRLSQVLLDVVQGREHLTIFGRITPPPMERVCGITSTWMMSWPPMRSWRPSGAGSTCRYHVGTGKGTSVRSRRGCRQASSHPIPVILGDRRPGDADSSWPIRADCKRWDGPPGMQILLLCSPAR